MLQSNKIDPLPPEMQPDWLLEIGKKIPPLPPDMPADWWLIIKGITGSGTCDAFRVPLRSDSMCSIATCANASIRNLHLTIPQPPPSPTPFIGVQKPKIVPGAKMKQIHWKKLKLTEV